MKGRVRSLESGVRSPDVGSWSLELGFNLGVGISWAFLGRPLVLIISVVFLFGCSPSSDLVPISLDKARPERLLSFYFGSYVGDESGDPFLSGLLVQEGNLFFVNVAHLDSLFLSEKLSDANNDGVIDWDELEPFLNNTYYEVRSPPQNLEILRSETKYSEDSSAWFVVGVDGMMTTAHRKIHIEREAVRHALDSYEKQSERIIYPVGTTIIAEHHLDSIHVETTVMQKRDDTFWDFFVYDSEGKLTPSTTTDPKPLTAPTQCVGCHFGNKPFEPEASFPSPAPDGPFGPRGIRIGDRFRNAEIASKFDEHRKRSDFVLGVYGTILESGVRSPESGVRRVEAGVQDE